MSETLITTLPLSEANRVAFIECANATFERVLARIEPANVEATRRLWDAEAYVDAVLGEDKLPIEWDYALHIVEAFLVSHVIELAVQADAGAVH